MPAVAPRSSLPTVELWILTIIIVGAVWVLGSVAVALGATWLVHHEPD